MGERRRRQDHDDVGPQFGVPQVELGGEAGDPEGALERRPDGKLRFHEKPDRDGVRDDLIEPESAIVGLVGGGLVRVSNDGRSAERLGQVMQLLSRPVVPGCLDLTQPWPRRLRVGHPQRLPLGAEGGIVRVQVKGQLPLAARADELGQRLLTDLGHNPAQPFRSTDLGEHLSQRASLRPVVALERPQSRRHQGRPVQIRAIGVAEGTGRQVAQPRCP